MHSFANFESFIPNHRLLDQNFNQPKTDIVTPNNNLNEEVIDFINQNFAQNYSVEDIAHKFKVSHVTLNQQLRQRAVLAMHMFLVEILRDGKRKTPTEYRNAFKQYFIESLSNQKS